MNTIENFKQHIPFTKTLDILFVEDNEEVRLQITKMLQNIFNHVETATNGTEAVTKYVNYEETNQKTYDIVITDISMPKMDGTALCKEILALDEEQIILVISAYTNPDKLLNLINLGVFKFIQKPIKQENLLGTIEEALIKLK